MWQNLELRQDQQDLERIYVDRQKYQIQSERPQALENISMDKDMEKLMYGCLQIVNFVWRYHHL